MNAKITVGLISDTHGSLSDRALKALQAVDVILHAGDIGDGNILETLRGLAPVEAVRGNMDYGLWAEKLPFATMVDVQHLFFYLIHDKDKIDLDPVAAGINVVVFGHTHRASIEQVDNIWYINPGSASHPRHGQRPSIALAHVSGKGLEARIINV